MQNQILTFALESCYGLNNLKIINVLQYPNIIVIKYISHHYYYDFKIANSENQIITGLTIFFPNRFHFYQHQRNSITEFEGVRDLLGSATKQNITLKVRTKSSNSVYEIVGRYRAMCTLGEVSNAIPACLSDVTIIFLSNLAPPICLTSEHYLKRIGFYKMLSCQNVSIPLTKLLYLAPWYICIFEIRLSLRVHVCMCVYLYNERRKRRVCSKK